MVRDLTYVQVHVEVSAGLPIHSHLDPATGRLELRLGRVFPVTLSLDRRGLARLVALLYQGRDRFDPETDDGLVERPEPG